MFPILGAWIRRWFHLMGKTWATLFRNEHHCGVDFYDENDRIIGIACTCDKVFWARGQHE